LAWGFTNEVVLKKLIANNIADLRNLLFIIDRINLFKANKTLF